MQVTPPRCNRASEGLSGRSGILGPPSALSGFLSLPDPSYTPLYTLSYTLSYTHDVTAIPGANPR